MGKRADKALEKAQDVVLGKGRKDEQQMDKELREMTEKCK